MAVRKNKPVLAVDQDDVLAILLEAWLEAYNKDFGDNLTVQDITSWQISKIVKPEAKHQIFDYLDIPEFMEGLRLKPGSQEYLKKLSEHFEIFVVTAPKNYNGVVSKAKWLQRYFPFIPYENYVFTINKSIVHADFLVDDGVHNLEGFLSGTPILFDAPHNQNEQRFLRVKTWEEAFDVIMEIAKRKRLL